MELDPHFCDVIIARWEKLTGKNAVRTHPLLDIRNKLQKQWQADWQAHRQEAFRRIQMKRMQQKQN